tara:strand:- start:395 stop:505 length:111 start_codon:yes stop_codon:yes gene_type:complete
MKVFAIIISLLFITSCATVKEPTHKECCKAKTELKK